MEWTRYTAISASARARSASSSENRSHRRQTASSAALAGGVADRPSPMTWWSGAKACASARPTNPEAPAIATVGVGK